MPTPRFSRDILLAALAGFQLDKQRIDAQIAEVQAMLDGGGSPATDPSAAEGTPKKKTRKRSAAVRKRMAEAQKTRWAKIKGKSEPATPSTVEVPEAKRRISEEGMKRIIAASKKRWRLQRASAKSVPAKKVAPKKTAVKKAAAKKTVRVVAQAVKEASV